jgi:hypothetical protein
MVLGDDSMVKVVGSGIVSIQRESLHPMLLRDVLYFLGLKNNLVSISTIEDRGYEVLFLDWKFLLYPKGSFISSAKVIGIQHENLYELMFHPPRALMHSTNNNDLCNLWHRRMDNFPHRDLRILRDIVTRVPEFSIEAGGV